VTRMSIDRIECVDELRKQAFKEKNDELLCCAAMLPLVLSEGLLQLPVEAWVNARAAPDVMLSDRRLRLGIEASRVTWQLQSQVLAEARKSWPNSLVELGPDLWVDKDARPSKKGSERGGDYHAIKPPGERLDGPGSIGDDHKNATIRALNKTLRSKSAKLKRYSFSDPVWLFLIDDGYPGAWSDMLKEDKFSGDVTQLCIGAGFLRVYLYRFSE
jgi:hypothetical protein